MSLKNKYEVIIVGYGPLGQLCALLLSKLGIKTAIIEKYHGINLLPSASVVDGHSLRFLNSLGCYDDLKDIFNIPEFLDYTIPDGKIIQRSPVKDTEDGYPNIATFYQPNLENTLRQKVLNTNLIDLYLAHDLLSIEEIEDTVHIKCKNLDENKLVEIEASFLLACDGVDSSIRKKLKIALQDLKYNKDWLIVDIDMNKNQSEPNVIKQICDFERPTSCTHLSGNKIRWEFQILPGEQSDKMLNNEMIISLLEKYINKNSFSIDRKDIYKFRAECSKEWIRGRVALLGGAAYKLPPFGYQSLNSEIRDINNLCWKLNLVIKNKCKIEILDSYKSEREIVAKETIMSSLAMGQLIDSIAISSKKNIPLEESVPPEARIQAFKSVKEKSTNKEKQKKIFFESDLTSSFNSLFSNFTIIMNNEKFLIDKLLKLNFSVFFNEDIGSLVSKDILQFYDEINANIYDSRTINFEDIFMKEAFKSHCFIIRPDKKIFGVSDQENSLQSISQTLKNKIYFIESL